MKNRAYHVHRQHLVQSVASGPASGFGRAGGFREARFFLRADASEKRTRPQQGQTNPCQSLCGLNL